MNDRKLVLFATCLAATSITLAAITIWPMRRHPPFERPRDRSPMRLVPHPKPYPDVVPSRCSW